MSPFQGSAHRRLFPVYRAYPMLMMLPLRGCPVVYFQVRSKSKLRKFGLNYFFSQNSADLPVFYTCPVLHRVPDGFPVPR